MAKKKLYGAAAAAHARKVARTSAGTTAIVRVSPAAPARRSYPRKRRLARASRAAVGYARRSGIVGGLMSKLPAMAGSAAYGWLTQPPTPADLAQLALAKQGKKADLSLQARVFALPYVEAIGRKATQGIALAVLGNVVGGMPGRIARSLSDAALHAWAFDLGRNSGDYEKAATVAGADSAHGMLPHYADAWDDDDDGEAGEG